jgi:hypothetical protein
VKWRRDSDADYRDGKRIETIVAERAVLFWLFDVCKFAQNKKPIYPLLKSISNNAEF